MENTMKTETGPEKICRACMAVECENMQSLYETDEASEYNLIYSEMIMAYTSVQVRNFVL